MFAVIDVETTGGQVQEDRVTEIAIVLTDGIKIIDEFSTLVNPERKIMPFVEKLTGINDEMVSTAPLFEEVADKVEEFTKDAIFVAHNINFDYSIIRKEFKRIGRTFRRQNLCTVKLSQKAIKDQPSYSLGNLCKNLGLIIENRHRALGDAQATVLLLQKIIREQGMEYVSEFGNQQTHLIDFKGALTREMIEELPEEPGIYRFLDADNNLLFVKAAKNIFAAVTKFLIKEIKEHNYKDLFEQIATIDTQVIHSFVVAEIQEIEEIRASSPIYNKSSLSKPYGIGVYVDEENLNRTLFYEKNSGGEALWRFQNDRSARRFIKKLTEENNLYIPPSNDFEVQGLNKQKLQEKLHLVLKKKLYPHKTFFIVREVSYANIYYVIYIKDFIFRGYAAIDNEFFDGKEETILDNLVIGDNNPFVQKIIQRYLQKKKNYQLIVSEH